ncbi:MAG: VOC family protein [Myxococcales bacterium]|nr:VOC family protein [Myxococcales bacterium]
MDDSQPPILSHFDHATVIVRDVAQASEHYQRLLGLEPSWRGRHPELGTEATLFGFKNGLLELVGPGAEDDERSAGLRALLDQAGEGLYALAFGTEDAARCRSELRARGLRAAPPEEGEAQGQDGSIRRYRSVELSPRDTRGLSLLAVERPNFKALLPTQEPAVDAVEAIDHVVIRTAEPDAAVALYGEALGIRLALDRQLGGTRMLFFRIGGVTVEVVPARPGPEARTGAHDADRDRFYGLAYRVRDIDGAHARLAAAGLSVSEIRDGNKRGTRVFTVRDGTCSVPTLVIRDPARD